MEMSVQSRETRIERFQRRRLEEASALIARITPSEEALMSLWAAVGKMERLLPDSNFMRAVYFGSARISDPSHPIYQETKYLSGELARLFKMDCVTGGGPSLMAAASEGAALSGEDDIIVHGACIEQVNRDEKPNPFLMKSFTHQVFPTRLHQFAIQGRRGIFIGLRAAGIGTLLETVLIWNLLQVAHVAGCPLVGIGVFYDDLKEVLRKHMVPNGTANDAEIDILQVVYHVDDVIPIAAKAHKEFVSLKLAG